MLPARIEGLSSLRSILWNGSTVVLDNDVVTRKTLIDRYESRADVGAREAFTRVWIAFVA
jgi:hypothetical protein